MTIETPSHRPKETPQIAFLPAPKNEDMQALEYFLPHFIQGNLSGNIHVLSQLGTICTTLLRRSERNESFELSDEDINLLYKARNRITRYKRLYKKYKNVIPELETSLYGYDSLQDEIDSKNRRWFSQKIETTRRNGRVSLDEMRNYAREQLENAQGDVLFVSDSHLTLHSQIEALYGMGYRDMGAVIFDRHHDYYLQKGDVAKLQRRGDSDTAGGNLHISKASFLAPLLDSGHLKALSIIGILSGQTTGSENFAPTVDFYNKHADKIHIGDFTKYTESHWKDKSMLPPLVKEQIRFLRESGVKHIILSFDIDVLRTSHMGYTAMEYSPLGHLAPLALMELQKLQDKPERNIQDFLQNMQEILDIEDNPQKVRHLLVSTATKDDIEDMDTLQKRGVYEVGTPFSVIARSINHIKRLCKEYGDIEFGVTLENGHKYFGDITELSGRDYKNRLARLLYKYIQRVFEK